MTGPEPVDTLPERRRRERLVALVVLGALALNYPLVALFSHVKLLLGIPLLYLYLFVVWLALIALIALSVAHTNVVSDDKSK